MIEISDQNRPVRVPVSAREITEDQYKTKSYKSAAIRNHNCLLKGTIIWTSYSTFWMEMTLKTRGYCTLNSGFKELLGITKNKISAHLVAPAKQAQLARGIRRIPKKADIPCRKQACHVTSAFSGALLIALREWD